MVNYKDHRGGYKWHEGYYGLSRNPKLHRAPIRYILFGISTIFIIIPANFLLKHAINKHPYWDQRVIYN